MVFKPEKRCIVILILRVLAKLVWKMSLLVTRPGSIYLLYSHVVSITSIYSFYLSHQLILIKFILIRLKT